ncbi:MAG TPA: RnfABCDGE type electron transport complex subunit B [Rhodanobacteraceae bacterium]|nr:RnfABCDGE type electron transport complex subunit B [Rhodanobacteraceae bacterium]
MNAPAPLPARIDALLPQTQCRQCGYAGCRPYADAIARGDADINRCAPGGVRGIGELAALLGRDPIALDPACGIEKLPSRARIDEAACIGCTKCIQACPVDAIVGAAKRMHTVIADECTGCELCLAPCPVDCIEMLVLPAQGGQTDDSTRRHRADRARERFRARDRRLERMRAERAARIRPRAAAAAARSPISRDAVLRAIAHGRAKRRARAPGTAHPPAE